LLPGMIPMGLCALPATGHPEVFAKANGLSRATACGNPTVRPLLAGRRPLSPGANRQLFGETRALRLRCQGSAAGAGATVFSVAARPGDVDGHTLRSGRRGAQPECRSQGLQVCPERVRVGPGQVPGDAVHRRSGRPHTTGECLELVHEMRPVLSSERGKRRLARSGCARAILAGDGASARHARLVPLAAAAHLPQGLDLASIRSGCRRSSNGRGHFLPGLQPRQSSFQSTPAASRICSKQAGARA
jgi:hypothetical protein